MSNLATSRSHRGSVNGGTRGIRVIRITEHTVDWARARMPWPLLTRSMNLPHNGCTMIYITTAAFLNLKLDRNAQVSSTGTWAIWSMRRSATSRPCRFGPTSLRCDTALALESESPVYHQPTVLSACLQVAHYSSNLKGHTQLNR